MNLASFGILCFSSLFTVIDPIATAPIFASLTKGTERAAARRIAIRASLVAFGVLALFAVCGAFLFRLFGITLDAFRIGGGIVFVMLGLSMLAEKPHLEGQPKAEKDPSVVPLGVPLIAGPGAITTVMVLTGQSTSSLQILALLLALIVALAATCALLVVSPAITNRLGAAGLELVTKVMGLIILVIGVQFVIDGIRPIVVDIIHTVKSS